ncbi:MAG: type IV pilin-like G/H family protein [Limnothrix sp.]
MKNFSFKLLQQLNQKKADKGFTLIELLVVIIIIGILSAIALPAFLNQANKARQSEAKQALGAINRGQQAYYLERQGFATDLDKLGLGVASFTQNYTYGPTNVTTFDGSVGTATGAGETRGPGTSTARGWSSYSSVVASSSNQEAVRDYVGLAFIVPADTTAGTESTTRSMLCEEEETDSTEITVATDVLASAFDSSSDCANNGSVYGGGDIVNVAQ